MAIIDKSYIEIDAQYHRGLVLDEYNGKISIVEATEGTDGEIYSKWGFPQKKDHKPSEKGIPWKVTIGLDVGDAIDTLKRLLTVLEKDQPKPAGESQFQGEPEDSDSIPF